MLTQITIIDCHCDNTGRLSRWVRRALNPRTSASRVLSLHWVRHASLHRVRHGVRHIIRHVMYHVARHVMRPRTHHCMFWRRLDSHDERCN